VLNRSASHSSRAGRPGDVRRDIARDPVRQNLAVLNPGVASPQRAPSTSELEREAGLRFVLRTRNRPRPETIQRRLRDAHGLVAEVRPLFRSLDAGARAGEIGRRYIVTLEGLSRRDIAVNPFELAYRLAETPGLEIEAAEPDLPHSVYAGNVANEALSFGGILRCEVDEEPALAPVWHLGKTRVLEAWTLDPPAGGLAFGEGILVGHPDTGWVVHDEVDASALDTGRSWDLVDDDADATDPLDKPWLSIGLFGQPGHGLGTGSVIVSRQAGRLQGVAPAAKLVPIRTVTRVWQIFSGELARGIEWAVTKGCHVVSMSLGGLPSEALERAVNFAVANDVIVCAAAGNCVHVVVAPGLYPNAVCVAASNSRDTAWRGSSRGPAVDIAAPGQNVWVARRRKGESGRARIGQSQGTSPATATVAGIAALWLAHHGREALLARYRGVPLQHVFLKLLRQTARHWNEPSMGAGIVDANQLLKAPLPRPADVAADFPDDPLRMLSLEEVAARMIAEPDPAPVRAELEVAFGLDVSPVESAVADEETEDVLTRFGPELLHILAEDRAAALQLRASVRSAALEGISPPFGQPIDAAPAGTGELARFASPSLRAQLRN
jgi:serine protease